MGHRPQPVLHFLSTPSVTSPRSGVFPTEWGHRGLGGAGRKRGALAVPSLQQQGPPVPSLGPASLPVFRGGAPTQTPPPQQLECPGRRVGLHQDRLVPSALGVGPWPVLVTLPLLLQTSRSSARGRPSTTWSCTSWPSTASSSRTSQPWPLPPLLPAPTSPQDSCERTTPRAPGSPACVCGPLDGVSGSLTLRVHHFPAGHHFGAPPALLNFQSH